MGHNDLTDNPYEQAFPREDEKLLEDVEEVLDSTLSRPEKGEEVLSIAQQYHRYTKKTEKVGE